jgi:hypothetical protein
MKRVWRDSTYIDTPRQTRQLSTLTK